MKKENILENKSIKNTNLDSIMKTYQSIMNQPKELNGPRPSIGTALRMDCKILFI